ncbi:Hypothetical predicted protein [Prunus dulcis]|uniref:Uncharacterized protein n=1 Tax=Prunus dulcis TaxID=3755 RepID=A0A5E4ERW6_PRUDU|nr:Hypothetical predicted protein [Prunus dulcis]
MSESYALFRAKPLSRRARVEFDRDLVLHALVEEVAEVVEVSGTASGIDLVIVVGRGGDIGESVEIGALGCEESGGDG